MATQIPTSYGPRTAKLFFDGDESKYKLWEMKTLGYLKIQHLHQIVESPTDQSDNMDFIEKNATVFTELIQYLDNRSLSLVMRDARDKKKSLRNIEGTLFIKRKAESYFSLYRTNIFKKTGIRVYYRLYKSREYF